MSEKTAASLARLDALIPLLQNLPPSDRKDELLETAAALRRAVAAFHMEAIRFRMFGVDRLLRMSGDDPASRQIFNDLRHELETAGFHTRSHSAP
jgi:2'-5' RNA ligase